MRRHVRPVTPVAGTLLVLLVAVGTAPAQQVYRVDLDADRLVRFISRANIQEFAGVTERIDGFIAIDTPALSTNTGGDDTELYFEVDLASLDTGIGLRNRHMRDNYLEVEEYPYAAFGGRITRVAPLAGGAYRITAHGTMGIHGVARERAIVCDATPSEARYRITCGFEILLSDYDIEIPRVMFLKLANEIRLELDFFVEPAEGVA